MFAFFKQYDHGSVGRLTEIWSMVPKYTPVI